VSPLKLDELRQRFGEAKGGDIFDPVLKQAAQLLFPNPNERLKPYSGISTFLDLPYLPQAMTDGQLAGLDVALIGVPMDLGVTNRPGARFGPRAVRAIERVGPFHHAHRIAPATMLKAADIGDVPFRSRFSLEDSHDDIERYFTQIAAAKVVPLAVGGDHSISRPILRALGREKPLGMIHIDAHCDTGGPFEDSKFHHGGPFRAAVLDGVLDPQRTIQIGIRGTAELIHEFSYVSGMTVLHAEKVSQLSTAEIVAMIRSTVGDGPIYLSFDVDSLDPAFAPGTGTPEIGGMSTRQVLDILYQLKGINIIGGDVVEVAPQYDPTSNTAQAGAQILFEIFCLVALAGNREI
jgi:guanidinopropionase